MAAFTFQVATPSTSNAASYAGGSFTPTVGDLLVVSVVASGTITNPATLTNSQGITFAQIGYSQAATAGYSIYLFIANSLVTSAVAQSCTFDCTGDNATGAVITVTTLTGMVRTGLNAVKQVREIPNQASGGTPSASFVTAPLTDNPLIGIIGNSATSASLTPPSGWTEQVDYTGAQYASPATSMEVATVNFGVTNSTVTWGSTSVTAYGIIIAEFDSSIPVAAFDTLALGSVTAIGALSASIKLGASIEVSSATGVTLTTGLRFAGTSASLVSVSSADLSSQINLAATQVIQTVALASLTTQTRFATNAAASTTMTGWMLGPSSAFEGALSCSSFANSAALSTQIKLAGSISSTPVNSASLSSQIQLVAIGQTSVAATGSLTVGSLFVVDAIAGAVALGTLTTQIKLAATTISTCAIDGELTAKIPLIGSVVVEPHFIGDLFAKINFAAIAHVQVSISTLLTEQIIIEFVSAPSIDITMVDDTVTIGMDKENNAVTVLMDQ